MKCKTEKRQKKKKKNREQNVMRGNHKIMQKAKDRISWTKADPSPMNMLKAGQLIVLWEMENSVFEIDRGKKGYLNWIQGSNFEGG